LNYLRDFYEQLNQSDSSRFEKWKDYRQQLSKIIMPSLNSSKHLLVIASGNGDDIDLSLFSQNVSTLSLADIDTDAMKRSLETHHLDSSTILYPIDFTNLSSTDLLEELYTTLILAKSKTDVDIYIEKLEKVVFSKNTSLPEQQYDIIIVCPIYTQMLIPIFYQSYQALKEKGLEQNLLNYAFEEMMALVSKTIDHFNHILSELLHHGGSLISISDIFESDIASPFYMKLSKDILDTKKMDQHLHNYQNKYGYGAGDFGQQNLEDYLSIQNHQWMIWPFSEQSHFFVKLTTFIK